MLYVAIWYVSIRPVVMRAKGERLAVVCLEVRISILAPPVTNY
jgi:hypothetical protein